MPQDQITRRIDEETRAPLAPQISAAADALRASVGDAAIAVLFYGSALRDDNLSDKIIDLYLLVDRYREAYDNWLPAVANAMLPPNVYYAAIDCGGQTVRIKYAIISLNQFEKQAAGGAFTPYIWGRFAQPTGIVYARDEDVRARIITALGNAVLTLIRKSTPLMTSNFGSADLWPRALRESYRTELRAEQKTKNQELYLASRERADFLLEAASDLGQGYRQGPEAGIYIPTGSIAGTLAAQISWRLRRPAGKILSVLRLAKAAFTFINGVDYILWKVERHSGVKITPTEWQRRHPLMAALTLSWRLYFKGGFR